MSNLKAESQKLNFSPDFFRRLKDRSPEVYKLCEKSKSLSDGYIKLINETKQLKDTNMAIFQELKTLQNITDFAVLLKDEGIYKTIAAYRSARIVFATDTKSVKMKIIYQLRRIIALYETFYPYCKLAIDKTCQDCGIPLLKPKAFYCIKCKKARKADVALRAKRRYRATRSPKVLLHSEGDKEFKPKAIQIATNKGMWDKYDEPNKKLEYKQKKLDRLKRLSA